jgi:hypothetical protein
MESPMRLDVKLTTLGSEFVGGGSGVSTSLQAKSGDASHRYNHRFCTLEGGTGGYCYVL